jgi:hypothetical protein
VNPYGETIVSTHLFDIFYQKRYWLYAMKYNCFGDERPDRRYIVMIKQSMQHSQRPSAGLSIPSPAMPAKDASLLYRLFIFQHYAEPVFSIEMNAPGQKHLT